MEHEIEEFANKINKKIIKLNKTQDGHCWICKKNVNNWGVIIPENKADDLGFGSKDKDTARVIFFPVCTIHDVNSKKNSEIIRKEMTIKKQELSN